jgi:hypothetical protein
MILRDILEDIQVHKTGTLHLEESFDKVFSNYMVTRYVSMMDDCQEVAQYCNRYQDVWSSVQMYKFLVSVIPSQSRYYIRYVSKPKKDKPKNGKTVKD